jgi:hypothetical protein
MRIVIRAVLAFLFCLLAGWAQAGTYYPKAGDTLAALARHAKSDVPCLMSLNKGVITDPNRIYVGRPIELGRCTKEQEKESVRTSPPLAVPDATGTAVWLPSPATPCADCAAEKVLTGMPEDVAIALLARTREDLGETVTVAPKERFALLELDASDVRKDAVTLWSDATERTATRFVVRAYGMTYALYRHGFGGWAIKDPSPDTYAYERIRDELAAASDERASAGSIDLIARLIWWRRMTKGFEDLDRRRAHALWVTAGLPDHPLPIP